MSLFTRWQAANANKGFWCLFCFWRVWFSDQPWEEAMRKSPRRHARGTWRSKKPQRVFILSILSSFMLYTITIIIIKLQTLLDLWFIKLILASLRKPARDQQEGHDHPGTLFCLTSCVIISDWFWNLIEIWNQIKLKLSSFPLFPVLLSVNYDIRVKIVLFH